MRLVLTEFVTLDGVSQGPGSPTEDTTDDFTRGGWLVPYIDELFVRRTAEWLEQADGLLLGRRTYDAFARDWPQITDPDDPYTDRMNSLPKYVVSSTLTAGTWHPTTVLRSLDDVEELKRQADGELQVHGSARLGNALLKAGAVDLMRLVVAPTVLGRGRRLFEQPGDAAGLRLKAQEATPSGLLLLEYETVGAAPVAEYEGVTAYL
ncbi:dihydrofolate reductase family protein [Kribbella sp. VKM Ac-2566]|uniref:dihydrofolate reductase family protein n=1 Tax=Kribbella sp. VKM Ac-2566 TaxID=2512218 RepID=UPI0010632505|nr:dihydrofolate reductase family protein [Kribbella sp. VKM Ac-2566]TDX03479.1 dihydrofolate reductase [Kribbella sp. VKM Ac-2566]